MPTVHFLSQLARELNIYLIGGSIPEIGESADRQVFNTCTVYDRSGDLIAKHRKVHLFDIDVPGKIRFMESETLSPGNSLTTFDAPELGIRVGLGICYDIRFPELSILTAARQCQLLVFPGAFNTTTGPAHWELLIRSRALDNQVFVAAVSPARSTDKEGYKAWGHSTVADPWANILATTEHSEDIVMAEIDLNQLEAIRSQIPVLRQKRTDLYSVKEINSDP